MSSSFPIITREPKVTIGQLSSLRKKAIFIGEIRDFISYEQIEDKINEIVIDKLKKTIAIVEIYRWAMYAENPKHKKKLFFLKHFKEKYKFHEFQRILSFGEIEQIKIFVAKKVLKKI